MLVSIHSQIFINLRADLQRFGSVGEEQGKDLRGTRGEFEYAEGKAEKGE